MSFLSKILQNPSAFENTLLKAISENKIEEVTQTIINSKIQFLKVSELRSVAYSINLGFDKIID
jgi:hypothetical protein